MKSIIIIQARMSSSRLPGKVLKPLGATNVLDFVVSRCKQIQNMADVIVATSKSIEDSEIEQWCKDYNISCFRGSETDVLSRYMECAKLYQPDYVIRVTGDSPFVDYDLANRIVNKMMKEPCDLIRLDGEKALGLSVEMFSSRALHYIHSHGQEQRHREHVTYYVYEYPEQFQTTFIPVPDYLSYPQLRLTLDTIEDYQMCQSVANHFKGNTLVHSKEVVSFLLKNPEVALLNAHIRQNPKK